MIERETRLVPRTRCQRQRENRDGDRDSVRDEGRATEGKTEPEPERGKERMIVLQHGNEISLRYHTRTHAHTHTRTLLCHPPTPPLSLSPSLSFLSLFPLSLLSLFYLSSLSLPLLSLQASKKFRLIIMSNHIILDPEVARRTHARAHTNTHTHAQTF